MGIETATEIENIEKEAEADLIVKEAEVEIQVEIEAEIKEIMKKERKNATK